MLLSTPTPTPALLLSRIHSSPPPPTPSSSTSPTSPTSPSSILAANEDHIILNNTIISPSSASPPTPTLLLPPPSPPPTATTLHPTLPLGVATTPTSIIFFTLSTTSDPNPTLLATLPSPFPPTTPPTTLTFDPNPALPSRSLRLLLTSSPTPTAFILSNINATNLLSSDPDKVAKATKHMVSFPIAFSSIHASLHTVLFVPNPDLMSPFVLVSLGSPKPGTPGDPVVIWAQGGDDDDILAVDGLRLPANAPVSGIAISPDGGTLALASSDGTTTTVHFYDPSSLIAIAPPSPPIPSTLSTLSTIAPIPFSPPSHPTFAIATTTTLSLISPIPSSSSTLTFTEPLPSSTLPLLLLPTPSTLFILSSTSSPSMLSLDTLTEGIPRYRLNALLATNSFAEAMEFALTNNLDPDLVLHKHIKFLTTSLLVDSIPESEFLDTVTPLLRQASNTTLAIHYILTTPFNSSTITTQLLQLAQNLALSSPTPVDPSLTEDITNAMSRLASFSLISTSPTFSGELWQRFRTAPALNIVRLLVAESKLPAAILVWSRHYAHATTSSDVLTLIQQIPEDVPVDDYLDWLQSHLFVRVSPTDRPALEAWVEQRARSVELKSETPHAALKLASSVSSFIKAAAASESTSFGWTPGSQVSAFMSQLYNVRQTSSTGLTRLVSQLADIVRLYDKHDFIISLSEYTRHSPADIAGLMIQRVPAEALGEELDAHVRPYLLSHNLVPDNVLGEYLVTFLEEETRKSGGGGGGWTNAIGSDDAEVRALALLAGIRELSPRAAAYVQFLRRVPIPWSEDVQAAMDVASKLGGPSADEISEQIRLLNLKAMFLRYGLRDVNLSDSVQAKALLRHILTRVDVDSAMDDGLLVVAAYASLHDHDAYVFHLQALIADATGAHADARAARAARLFASLSLRLQLSVGQELILWIQKEYSSLLSSSTPSSNPIPTLLRLAMTLKTVVASCVEAEAKAKAEALAAPPGGALPSSSTSAASSSRRANSRSRTSRRRVRAGMLHSSIAAAASSTSSSSSSTAAAAAPFVYLDLASLTTTSRALSSLLTEFAIPVPLSAFSSREQAMEQLSLYISAQEKVDKTHVYRLVELLGLSRTDLDIVVASAAAASGDPVRTTAVCRQMMARDKSPTSASALVTIAGSLLTHATSRTSVPTRACALVQNGLAHCTDDDLVSFLDRFRTAEALVRVSHLSQQSTSGSGSDSTLAPDLYVPTNTNNAGASSSSSSSSAPSSTTPSSTTPSSTTPSTPAALIRSAYPSHYHEAGLDMDLPSIMPLALSASGLSPSTPSTPSTPPTPPTRSSKGKEADDDDEPTPHTPHAATNLLISQLTSNGWVQLALSLTLTLARDGDTQALASTTPLQTKLVHKVLGSRRLDRELAVAYMWALPYHAGHNTFQMAASRVNADYERLGELASIGQDVAFLWNQHAFGGSCDKLRANARWWSELALLEIPFDATAFTASNGDNGYQASLVTPLLKKTGLDIQTVLEFTETYMLSDQAALLDYMTILLVGDQSSRDQVTGAYSLVYQEEVARIVGNVDPAGLVHTMNTRVLPYVSEFDYDRIKFVYHVLDSVIGEEADAKGMIEVVKILQTYTRHAPSILPQSMEEREAENDPRVTAALRVVPRDVVAEWERLRVPFFELVRDPLAVLKNELTPSSLRKLRGVAAYLELGEDVLVIELIENLVLGGERTFDAIRPYLAQVNDTERAIEVGQWVADEFGLGKDRAKTLDFCCTLGAKLKRETRSSQHAVALHDHLRAADKETRLQLLLVDSGLESFLEYSANPEELICQLYFQLGAEEYLREARSEPSKNLHYVVDNIASMYSDVVDEKSTRDAMVQLWLTEDDSDVYEPREDPLPAALLSSRSFLRIHGFGPEWEVLMRTGYILMYDDDINATVVWLLNFSFQEASLRISSLARAKGIQLVFALADRAVIEGAYPGSGDELKAKLESFLYLSEFERARFPYTMAELSSGNKHGLVRGLWRTHGSEPESLELVVKLAIDHGVVDDALWSQWLTRLLDRGETEVLLRCLEFVVAHPSLGVLREMERVWAYLLDQAANSPSSSDQGAGEMMYWLQRCPSLVTLDVGNLVQGLVSRGDIDRALEVALLVPDREARQALLFELLDTQDLILQVLASKKLRIGEHDAIISGFASTLRNQGYDSLSDPSALGALDSGILRIVVEEAVKANDILGLVRTFLNSAVNNTSNSASAIGLAEAEEVVKYYAIVHPDVFQDASEDDSLLETFLVAHGDDQDFDLLLEVQS